MHSLTAGIELSGYTPFTVPNRTSSSTILSDIKYMDINNNLIRNNTGNGINILGSGQTPKDIVIENNNIYGNALNGINVTIPTDGLALKGNMTKRNTKGLSVLSNNQLDTIIKSNVFMDEISVSSAQFTRVTGFNELII